MKTVGYEKDYYGKENFSVRNQKMSSQESSPPPKMKNEFSSGSHEDLYRKAKSTISAGTYLDFMIIKENLALTTCSGHISTNQRIYKSCFHEFKVLQSMYYNIGIFCIFSLQSKILPPKKHSNKKKSLKIS